MARPYWSGQIQISLVSFGVSLFPATSAASQVKLHQIDRKSGERVHHRNVTKSAAEDEGDDDGAVEKADIIKGYEYRKGEYVTLEPDELAKIRIPGKKTLAIAQFVGIDELGLSFFEKPYFVVPQNDTQASAFAVVREALKQTGKAGLGEIAFSGREHLVALMAAPDDARGMMAYTLRYQQELRSPAEYMAGIAETQVDKDQLSLAKELIERSSAPFDPSKFKDDYESALKELLEAKVENRPLTEEEEEQPKSGKVVNLMDALRRSLAQDGKAKKRVAREPEKTPKTGQEVATGITTGIATGVASKTSKKGPQLVKQPVSRRKSA